MRNTKSELIKRLHIVDAELEKTGHSETEMHSLHSKKRRVRRALYECDCCADATIFRNKGHGESREKIGIGCTREECLYKDYFEDMARMEDEKNKELLKKITIT
jgi:hypothetical protein